MTHCGVCHSDLHLIDNERGMSTYPLVPGHEIVGSVTRAVGEVAGLESGQRVAVGWLRGLMHELRTVSRRKRGGRFNAEMHAMFQFSVEHAIIPVIELYTMKDVNQALERLRRNQVRYRAVLAN